MFSLTAAAKAECEFGSPRFSGGADLGERRLQLRFHLLAEPPLELGVGGKAEPPGKAQDGRRADAAPRGKLGDRLQAEHRIVCKQRPRRAALGGGQLVQPIADRFGD